MLAPSRPPASSPIPSPNGGSGLVTVCIETAAAQKTASIKARCHSEDELRALQDPYACRIGWARVATGSQRRVGSHDGSPRDDLLLLVLKKSDPEWRRTDTTIAGDDGFSNGGALAPRFPAISQSHLQTRDLAIGTWPS